MLFSLNVINRYKAVLNLGKGTMTLSLYPDFTVYGRIR